MRQQPRAKYCKGCRRVKAAAHFYANRKQGGTLSPKCKPCTCRDVRRNRRNNIERYRQYDKDRWHNNPERRAAAYASLKAAAERDPERYRGYKRAWRDSRPAARRAHVAVGNAIRDGRLARQPCEVCGAPEVEAHHDDYAKPLEVRWMCIKHHNEWHMENGPGLNGGANDADRESA